jgi:4a-hydroxytetrahydrobiopterin dehydratase
MREALSFEAIQELLPTVPDWQLVQSTLHREFVFPDFVRAFGFMASVAAIAQALDHHPDWENVYNRVRIRLSTHDVNGLGRLDFEMARRIDQLVP